LPKCREIVFELGLDPMLEQQGKPLKKVHSYFIFPLLIFICEQTGTRDFSVHLLYSVLVEENPTRGGFTCPGGNISHNNWERK